MLQKESSVGYLKSTKINSQAKEKSLQLKDSYLSKEGRPSLLDSKTVREPFDSYGSSITWYLSYITRSMYIIMTMSMQQY